MKNLSHFDFNGKRALIRVDFNVPLNSDFQITDFTRIKAATPTIKKILSEGGSVVLMSHLGRPKAGPEEKFSLKHLVSHLSEIFDTDVQFASDCVGEESYQLSASLQSGQVLLLENLRFYKEETAGDVAFAEKLSKHGDIYINDAFGTAHRSHASNVGIAKHFSHKGIGLLVEKELNFLSKIISKPPRPLTLLLGGAKIDSKIDLIDYFIGIADNILIGGGMAFTLLAAKGFEVGNSLVDQSKIGIATELIEKAKAKNNLILPRDSVCVESPDSSKDKSVYDVSKMPNDTMGLDIGPKTIELFSSIIGQSKTVIWNGPMGMFEKKDFKDGTRKLAECVASNTEEGLISITGGGDTASALRNFNLENKMTHLSTGGGASIELLSGKALPALFALEV